MSTPAVITKTHHDPKAPPAIPATTSAPCRHAQLSLVLAPNPSSFVKVIESVLI
jgi:hypothetical protein